MTTRALAALLLLFSLSCPAAAREIASFVGVWQAEGYSCYVSGGGLEPSIEQVEIVVSEGGLSAVKIDRTPCPGLGKEARRAGVPSGEISWRAHIPESSVTYGRRYDTDSHLASPRGDLTWAPGEIEFTGPDEIRWWTPSAAGQQPIIFRRRDESPPVS